MGAKEVAAGAAWLDENHSGWERKIDLGTLNIRFIIDHGFLSKDDEPLWRDLIKERFSTGNLSDNVE